MKWKKHISQRMTVFVNFTLQVPLLFSGALAQTMEIHKDFKKYYDQFQVTGSFVLYDQQNDKFIVYNKEQAEAMFTPASTFKICNSLIGLETGVISDEYFTLPWDSIIRENEDWNRDHNLKSAFQNSTVWYYRELARRVGTERMKFWLDKANYGNADTTGGIDKFWLAGGLKISPFQQVDFLKRFYYNNLPFSQRNIEIVKRIMCVNDSSDGIICAKTGWGSELNKDIGWYVGYFEKKGKVCFFANCIQTEDFNNNYFAKARVEIVSMIIEELGFKK